MGGWVWTFFSAFHIFMTMVKQVVVERTTGVINTVRGYHATSCSLVWFAVYRMGRQTQLWSGPMREHVALALLLQRLSFMFSHWSRPNSSQGGWVIYDRLVFT